MSLDLSMSNIHDYANNLPDNKRRVLTALLEKIEDARSVEKAENERWYTNGLIEALEIVMREL